MDGMLMFAIMRGSREYISHCYDLLIVQIVVAIIITAAITIVITTTNKQTATAVQTFVRCAVQKMTSMAVSATAIQSEVSILLDANLNLFIQR